MDAIILAAGTGSRLLNLTRDNPKALVKVRGRFLIDYAVSFAHDLGCHTVFVVGGFYLEKIKAHLSGRQGIVVLENSDFLNGSILTIQAALPLINSSFMLMNVDHIYPSELGKKLRHKFEKCDDISAIVDFDRVLHEDDMKVLLDENGRILRIAKNLQAFQAGYIGMSYVPASALQRYKTAVDQTAFANADNNVEKALQRLADDGPRPSVIDASRTRWLEIDNQNDLLNAERILQNVPDFLA